MTLSVDDVTRIDDVTVINDGSWRDDVMQIYVKETNNVTRILNLMHLDDVTLDSTQLDDVVSTTSCE